MGNPDVSVYQLSLANEVHRNAISSYIPDNLLGRKNLLVFGAVTKEYGLVGALLASVYDGIIEIEYICVHEKLRRQGIGTKLINKLLMLTDQVITQYVVTLYVPKDPEHTSFLDFINSLGVFMMKEYNNRYYVKADTITTNVFIQKCVNRDYSVRAISLSDYSRNKYAKVRCADYVRNRNLQDDHLADELALDNFGTLSRMTSFVIESDDRIVAVMLTHFAKNSVLDISHVFFESDDGNYLGALIKALYGSVVNRGIDVIFTTMSKTRKAIADKFFKTPYESTVQATWCGILPDEMIDISEL